MEYGVWIESLVCAAMDKLDHPVASQVGMFALLSQQAHDTSADLTVGQSIAQGLLTEYPRNPAYLLGSWTNVGEAGSGRQRPRGR
jgi:hypothetical protein